MTDFVEWNPKHHGHQPLHWTPDMLTSVDGKNFVRQPNWAWIAGSVYYVPPEAVGMVREVVEPEPVVTDADRIEALTAEIEWLRRSADGWEADSLRYAHNAEYWKAENEELREYLSSALETLRDAGVCDDGCSLCNEAFAALEKQP
jgi:hypothetical protein